MILGGKCRGARRETKNKKVLTGKKKTLTYGPWKYIEFLDQFGSEKNAGSVSTSDGKNHCENNSHFHPNITLAGVGDEHSLFPETNVCYDLVQ